jgi:hypothetical protein
VVEAIEIEKKFWKGGRAFMGLNFSIDNQTVKHAAAYVDKRNSRLGWCEGSPGEVRTNRTGLDGWIESAVAVGVVESRRAEDEWYSLSYGQCHKILASGIAGVRTDRAGAARNAGDPCRRSPLNKDGSWGRSRLNPLAPEVHLCICTSVHLCLRIKGEDGLFAGVLGLESGGYRDESTRPTSNM